MSKFLDNTGLTYLWSKIKATARNVVHVGTTAPTDDIAQVWINPDGETSVSVPTVSEMNAALAEKIDEPASDGSAGQVLTTDGNGGRSWATVQGGVPSPATAGTTGQVLSLDSNLNTVWVDADSLLTAAEEVSF